MFDLTHHLLQGFNLPAEGVWFWFEGMIDLFFYVDLALNFFTAYEVTAFIQLPAPEEAKGTQLE